MSAMVTKHSGIFISPSEMTPAGNLPLSSIDRSVSPGAFIERIFVFKHGPADPTIVRLALSKALVSYYPLAGRLIGTEVACTGEGVWFVEASAECTLQDVNSLEDMPLKIPKEDLISFPPDPVGVPIILQLTKFACGGFVLSFVYDHAIADGVGMAQFMIAVSELARGEKGPSVKPIWCRDQAVLNPPLSPLAFIPSTTSFRNVYFLIDICSDKIDKLKFHFKEQTGVVYSTFEILAAKTWQSRARAINADPDRDHCLVFPANVRAHLLSQTLPAEGGGYYGNCIFPLLITMPIKKLISVSTVEVMKMIREEKERLATKVAKWSKGEVEPLKLSFGYHTTFMSVWTRHGFEEVDFGFGKPSYVAPTMNCRHAQVYIVRPPASKKGVRLITQCVVEDHLAKFEEEMTNVLGTALASQI